MDEIARDVARRYRRTHDRLLSVVGDLSDDQLRRRLGRTNSIGFNLWHVARWADHLQSILSVSTPELRRRVGERPEVWSSEALARRWGFDQGGLGTVETGMGMDEDASAELPLPGGDEVRGYARRAFAAAQTVLDAIAETGDAGLRAPVSIDPARIPFQPGHDQGLVLNWVLGYLEHDERHLGMIEAIRGAIGLRGTATS